MLHPAKDRGAHAYYVACLNLNIVRDVSELLSRRPPVLQHDVEEKNVVLNRACLIQEERQSRYWPREMAMMAMMATEKSPQNYGQ